MSAWSLVPAAAVLLTACGGTISPGGVAGAFERAASACNACHQASAKAFIQVPAEMGRTVPDLDPAPAPPAAPH